MKTSALAWLSLLLAGCDLKVVGGAKRDKAKDDGSLTEQSSFDAAPESIHQQAAQSSYSGLSDEQRQMLLDNLDRRMEKIRRIEGKLEGLRQKYPKANMFAIVQEQLDEIKAQLDAA